MTVTINFAEVEHVDYLRYTPRPGGGNGDWNEVTLSYYDSETKKYQHTTLPTGSWVGIF